MDRRGFLKWFGIGTIVAPVLNSELQARIVAPPKVEIISAEDWAQIEPSIKEQRNLQFVLTMWDGHYHRWSGKVLSFEGPKAGETFADMHIRVSQRGPIK